ncbi:DUF721 domain-containing protein [Sphaerothrix gracilis]|uniref:DUF721 domain-containing protein n=1 Tax=Sphaerothrix gracilis TaxID=3151835 RepID=UPI0031FD7273
MTFQSLDQLVNQLQRQKNWRVQQQFRRLTEVWPDIVGVAVARQTRPVGITRYQVLRVATATPAWSQTLIFERHRILQKLNQQLALKLTDIRFSVAQWHTDQKLEAIAPAAQALQQHPSFIKTNIDPSHVPNAASQEPTAAFERWAGLRQQQTRHCPLCPQCQCPTPPGELERWSACALCAAKQW